MLGRETKYPGTEASSLWWAAPPGSPWAHMLIPGPRPAHETGISAGGRGADNLSACILESFHAKASCPRKWGFVSGARRPSPAWALPVSATARPISLTHVSKSLANASRESTIFTQTRQGPSPSMGPWPFRACSSWAPSLVLEIALVLQFRSSFLLTSRAKVQHTSERRAVPPSPSPELQVGGSASDADQATPSPALRSVGRWVGKAPGVPPFPSSPHHPTPGHGKGADTKFTQLGFLSLCWTSKEPCA